MHPLFQQALEDFALFNRGRNLSEKTISWYTDQLTKFGCYLEQRNRIPTSIKGMDIVGFLAGERQRGLSDTSIDARYRALRAFFRWVERHGYFDGLPNPVATDYKPKVRPRIKRSAKTDEVQHLLASITGEQWADARDRAIISLLFRTGLRRGEVVGLRLENIDFTKQRILVSGETSKSACDSIVPFDKETHRLLLQYLDIRPPHPTDSSILWYANDGSGGIRPEGLTGDGIYLLIKRRCEKAGLDGLSPQSFRRGFGGAMLNVGVNIGEVSALLRHSSVKITETWYVEHELDILEATYRAAQSRLK